MHEDGGPLEDELEAVDSGELNPELPDVPEEDPVEDDVEIDLPELEDESLDEWDPEWGFLALSPPDYSYCAGWRTESMPRPSREEVAQALESLKRLWPDIAGEELADNTAPLAFTGRKFRRLVVCVFEDREAPWGGWDWLDRERRHAFTRLRAAVNEAIAPLGVDHIDFLVGVRPREEPADG